MAKIAIVSDNNSDITESLRKQLDIRIVSDYVKLGHEIHLSKLLSAESIWNHVTSHHIKKKIDLSPAKPSDLLETYEKLKEEGYDSIFSIHTSSKITNTIISANIAKGMIDGIDIRIIDTKSISIGQLAVIRKAHKLIGEKKKPQEIEHELNQFITDLAPFFVTRKINKLIKPAKVQKKYQFPRLWKNYQFIRQINGSLKVIEYHRLSHVHHKLIEHTTRDLKKHSRFDFIIGYSSDVNIATEIEKAMKSAFPKSQGMIVEIGSLLGILTSQDVFALITFKL